MTHRKPKLSTSTLFTTAVLVSGLALSACSPPQDAQQSAPQEPAATPPTAAPTVEPPGDQISEGPIFPSAQELLATGAASSYDVVLFYLHGRIIEDAGRRPEHPQHGVYEYDRVLEALAVAGAAVISEARAPSTDVDAYAARVVEQIASLLSAGVDPSKVTVIGFSKGGSIALRVSHLLAHDDVGFVILAACGPWLDNVPLELRGRMLSIHEASDTIGTCRPWVDRPGSEPFFHEVEIAIGGGHGAFYQPHPEWLDQTLLWTGAPSVRQGLTAPERLDTDG